MGGDWQRLHVLVEGTQVALDDLAHIPHIAHLRGNDLFHHRVVTQLGLSEQTRKFHFIAIHTLSIYGLYVYYTYIHTGYFYFMGYILHTYTRAISI